MLQIIINMSTEKNKKNFNWVYFVVGSLTGMLAVLAVTTSFISVVLGGVIGLIFAGLFLNKIASPRQH